MTTLRLATPTTPPETDDRTPEDYFAATVTGIYADQRADPQTRELLIAMAYAISIGQHPDTNLWNTVSTALGRTNTGRPRHKELVRRDVPRYVEPGRESLIEGICEAARHRPYTPRDASHYGKAKATDDHRNTDRVCGAHGTLHVTERDPRTGWHILHWFCSRHRDQAARVRDQVAEQNEAAPEPIPNAGGLLPSYFQADWVKVYRWALGNPLWEPPSWGICADDWPVPGQDPIPSRSRLRLIVGADPFEEPQP